MDERRRAMGEYNWMRAGGPPSRVVAIFGQVFELFESGNRLTGLQGPLSDPESLGRRTR